MAGASIGWPAHMRRVGAAAAAGLGAVWLAALWAPVEIATAIGWDVAALLYTARIWWKLVRVPPEALKAWSAEEDEGRVALTVALSAAVAISVTSIFAMVTDGSGGAVISLAAFTIFSSWTLLHTVFAAHYAHRCFADGPEKPGLDFPGGTPDFIDFAYYAFTIGMTFQTSDVDTRSSAMRRLTLAHAVVSFVFNTVIIAISVGLAGGLLGG